MPFQGKIEDQMTTYPVIADEKMSVTQAVELMKQNRFRHLPVVRNGKVIGVISDRDLRQATLLSDSMQLVVSDVMVNEPYCVPMGTALEKVVRKMAETKIGSAVVLDRKERVIGIFTTTDAMKILAELLADGAGSTRHLGIERFLSSGGEYLV